jgi:release factor glutamine methyltransferase
VPDTEGPDSVRVLLRTATDVLAAAGVASPRWDAEELLAFAAGIPRARLATLDAVAPDAAERFRGLVDRRAQRDPLQHLTGSTGFRHLVLRVGPGVFVPRPETEVVAGAAVEAARAAGPHPVVVDLCSGSGAIALSVAQEVPAAQVHAVEADSGALDWLRRNAAERVVAGDRAVVVHAADVADALSELDGTVDVVVANPPYLPVADLDVLEPEVRDHDPLRALVAPDDGLAVIRSVARTAWRLLRPGGVVLVEHGDQQGQAAPAVLTAAGFTDVHDEPDLAGRPRLARGRRPYPDPPTRATDPEVPT